MNYKQLLEDRFMQFCDRYGYSYHGVSFIAEDGHGKSERYALNLGLKKPAQPPDLGVHIRDGIGTEDKLR